MGVEQLSLLFPQTQTGPLKNNEVQVASREPRSLLAAGAKPPPLHLPPGAANDNQSWEGVTPQLSGFLQGPWAAGGTQGRDGSGCRACSAVQSPGLSPRFCRAWFFAYLSWLSIHLVLSASEARGQTPAPSPHRTTSASTVAREKSKQVRKPWSCSQGGR